MGLTKRVSLDNGLLIENAYFRVDSFQGNEDEVNFVLTSYVNRQSYLDKKANLDAKYYNFIPDFSDNSPNIKRQIYAYLKSVDDFIEASDVLESGQTPL